MKAQDLFINEKYRPIAKTVGDSWEDSFEIRAIKNNDQDFLYYTGIEPTSEGEQHSFHHEKICGNADVSGDFFKPEDMIEYIEPGDWVKVINIKKSYSMYSQMFRKMGFNDKHSNLEHNIENGFIIAFSFLHEVIIEIVVQFVLVIHIHQRRFCSSIIL